MLGDWGACMQYVTFCCAQCSHGTRGRTCRNRALEPGVPPNKTRRQWSGAWSTGSRGAQSLCSAPMWVAPACTWGCACAFTKHPTPQRGSILILPCGSCSVAQAEAARLPPELQGHGRSAAVAAALLVAEGEAPSADAALEKVKELRPGASPNHRQVAVLRSWAAKYTHPKYRR